MARTATVSGNTVYVPTDTFVADVDGVPSVFQRDTTRVREGHPILDQYPDMFKPITVHYEWEQATSSPGEKRA